MNATFIPFASLSSAVSLGAALESPGTLPRQPFRPVSAESQAPQVEDSRGMAGAHHPTVTVHREGDSVRRIQIQCSCGQVIDLDCQY